MVLNGFGWFRIVSGGLLYQQLPSEHENDKSQVNLNIYMLSCKTCDKTHVNENSNDEENELLDEDEKKLESEEITKQSNPNILHKKDLAQLQLEF